MCAAVPRSICIFVWIDNNHKIHRRTQTLTVSITITTTKNREHCTWHIQIDAVCLYSLKCDVLSAWEWERKCQILTLDKHTSFRNVTNDNVTSNSAITVQWSIKSLSLSLCVCSNTVKFQPCDVYMCVYDFFIFSLWYTLKLANKMADRSTYTFYACILLTKFKSNVHVLFCVCLQKHTHAFITRSHALNTHKWKWEMKFEKKNIYNDKKNDTKYTNCLYCWYT